MNFSDTHVRITLINCLDKAKSDITVTIRKDFMTGEYVATYVDPNDGLRLQHTLNGLYYNSAMEYVDHILKGAVVDDDGPISIQVDCPALPSILMAVSKVRGDVYYRDHLLQRIGFGLTSLESTSRGLPGPRHQPVREESAETLPVRQHLFFHE